MSRRYKFLIAVVCLSLSSTPLWASGSTRPSSSQNSGFESFSTVDSRRCKVLEVRLDQRVLRVLDHDSGRETWLEVADATPIRPRKKADFDGRKKLAFDDFAIGQELVVSHRTDTGRVVSVRIR